MSPDEFGLWAAQQLEAKIQELGEDQVAAFIAEPMIGAGTPQTSCDLQSFNALKSHR